MHNILIARGLEEEDEQVREVKHIFKRMFCRWCEWKRLERLVINQMNEDTAVHHMTSDELKLVYPFLRSPPSSVFLERERGDANQ